MAHAPQLEGDPPRPIRVIVPFNTPYLYGMERAVIELFSALRPEVEAHFVTAESFKLQDLPVISELERRGLAHSFLPDGNGGWPGWGKPSSPGEAFKLFWTTVVGNVHVLRRGWNCDVVYLPSPRYISAWCLALAMRLRGRAVLYHCHDLAPTATVFAPWNRLISHCVFSTDTARAVAGRYVPALPRLEYSVIPLVTRITNTTAAPCPNRIVYAGQLDRHKGIDLLLDAFAMVAAKCPSAELHLAGGVSDAFRKELERQAQSQSNGGRIRILGYVEDVPALLRTAAVYVQPSPPSRVQEAFGRSVVEAMAMGVPVVCFRSGSLGEIVQDGVTGMVCREENSAALADAILRLLDDSSLRKRLGEAAMLGFEQRYSERAVRERWLALFRGLARIELSTAAAAA